MFERRANDAAAVGAGVDRRASEPQRGFVATSGRAGEQLAYVHSEAGRDRENTCSADLVGEENK